MKPFRGFLYSIFVTAGCVRHCSNGRNNSIVTIQSNECIHVIKTTI